MAKPCKATMASTGHIPTQPHSIFRSILPREPMDIRRLLLRSQSELTLGANLIPITRHIIRAELNMDTGDIWEQPDSRVGPNVLCIIYMKDHKHQPIQKIAFNLNRNEACSNQAITFYFTVGKKLPPKFQIQIVMQSKINCAVQLNQLKMDTQHIYPAMGSWSGGPCGKCGINVMPEIYEKPINKCHPKNLPLSKLANKHYESIYATEIESFNCFQAHVFQPIYNTDDNLFIGSCIGNGKKLMAELAILRMFHANDSSAKCVYVHSKESMVSILYEKWKKKFNLLRGATVVKLTGDYQEDVELVKRASIILASVEAWNYVSLNWSNTADVRLYIFDDLQLLSTDERYEFILMRLRFMTSHSRIVALCAPVANPSDIAQYLGVTRENTFNFQTYYQGTCPVPTWLSVVEFDEADGCIRDMMALYSHQAILAQESNKPVLIWVPSNKDTLSTALRILTDKTLDEKGNRDRFKGSNWSSMFLETIEDSKLRSCLAKGIGFIDETISPNDRQTVETLFRTGSIQVVIICAALCWSFDARAFLVIIMDTFTTNFQWNAQMHSDYDLEDFTKMVGYAGRHGVDDHGMLMVLCRKHKKKFFEELLSQQRPIESPLILESEFTFANNINEEVINGNLKMIQDLRRYVNHSFLMVRLTKNNTYYSLRLRHVRIIADKRPSTSYQCGKCLKEGFTWFVDLIAKSYSLAKGVARITPQTPLKALTSAKIAFERQVDFHFTDVLHSKLLKKVKPELYENVNAINILMVIMQSFEFFHVNYFDLAIRDYEYDVLRDMAEKIDTLIPEFRELQENGVCLLDHVERDLDCAYFFHAKACLLLLAHLARLELPLAELKVDQHRILDKALRLCHACIDIFVDYGWLKFAIASMDLAQSIVQAVMPSKTASLWQIPHFSREIVDRCISKGCENLRAWKSLDKEAKQEVLEGFNETQLKEMINFVKHVPERVIHTKQMVADTGVEPTGKLFTKIHVKLRGRDLANREPVIAPHFPKKVKEKWWLLLSEMYSGHVVAYTEISPTQTTVLNVRASPKDGEYAFILFLKSSCYLGRDRAYLIQLNSTPTTINFRNERSACN